MLGHGLTLAVFSLLSLTPHPEGTRAPAAAFSCTAAADSLLDFTASADGTTPWSDAVAYRAVRRLTDAASAKGAAYTPKCFLTAAEAVAREAVSTEPAAVDRHYALAVVLGLRADREGGRAKVRAASDLYNELETILAMNPNHVGAHHLLGRLQAGVMRMDRATRWIATHLLGGAALSGASWSEAERNLAYAAAAAPFVPDYHYELAHLYEDTGRPKLALEQARAVLAMDPSTALEDTVPEKAAALVRRIKASERKSGGQ